MEQFKQLYKSLYKHEGYCYLNGEILLIKRAYISPLDSGFMRGYCVTDFLRTYNGKVFMFDEHYKRFQNGAKLLGLKIPESQDKILQIINIILKKNKKYVPGDFKIKILLSGGIGKTDLDISKYPTLFIYASAIPVYSDKLYKNGAKLITYKYHRYLPEIKTSNYIEAIRQQKNINKEGAIEVLYTGDKYVSECSTSNFFVFKNGKLINNTQGILEGITRLRMLQIAKKFFPIIERPIAIKELKNIDEAFITSTTKEIMPIVQIDNIKIGNGKVGLKTKKLMEEFKKSIK